MSDPTDPNEDTDHHDPDAPVTVADKEREPTPYERKLRVEAARYRRKANESERTRAEEVARITRERDETVTRLTKERDDALAQAIRDRDDGIATTQRERDEAVSAAQRERDERIAETQREASERLIRAEMKAAALRAGMVDPDGLKLLDLSGVTLGEDGEITVPDGFFEAARQAKPFLFGTPSSSNPTPPPKPQPPRAKRATEWSDAEVREAEQRIARGQKIA